MTKNRLILLLLLAGLLSSCGCSKKARELPEVNPDSFQRYSQDNVLSSEILGSDILYSVYFPESYMSDKEKRYPVVYMLHGLGDNNNSWNGNYLHANSKVDAWTAKGLGEMIYVFPQGFNSYYCNRYDGSYDYMDMFVHEFIPLIDRSLRTIPDREHRAITGYSMGGFGAMALAEKHPELFIACAPLSMSVRTDAQYMAESMNGWNNQWGFIFGGIGQAGEGRITDYYRQYCPLHYFNTVNQEALSTVHWWLICGDNEANLLYANDALHIILRNNGYEHEYRVVDGGHSSSVWMPALDEVLPMFDYYMNGGTLWSPLYGTELSAALPSVEVLEDGAFLSPGYADDGSATALYVVHDGSLADDMGMIMAAAERSTSKIGYALLPCDLSMRSLPEWMAWWDERHPTGKKEVLAIGDGGAAAMALGAEVFYRSYYIDAAVGEAPEVVKDQEIYFATTDCGVNYADMGALYVACKDAGAVFEYRVVNGRGDDSLHDILKCIETIKSYLIY